MKSAILLLAFFTAAFTSCTTAYKTGQTPDDVYYSPVRPQGDEYVQTDKQDDRQYSNDEYYDDRYLRMKVKNRYRWSDMDDSYYYNRRYSYSSYNCCCFGNPWTPYSYWNNYYNPYSQKYSVVSPATTATYNKPRTFNLNAYNSNALTNNNYTNQKYSSPGNNSNNNTNAAPRNRNSNRNNNAGNILRDVFSGNNNSSSTNNNSSNSNSNNSSSSNSNSSSSSSSSSGSSSGSTAPVRKF